MLQQAYDFLLKDPTLSSLVLACQLPKIEPSEESMANHLIRSIVSQQLSTKAAATIYRRFTNLFNNNQVDLDILLSKDDDELRSAGLSYSKSSYVKNVASYFLNEKQQSINWSTLEDQNIISELTQIKGVGIWTVQMILIFKLNRPDVLPLDDLIVRKGLINVLNLNPDTPKIKTVLTDLTSHWRPHRSYVSRLMWKAKELDLINL